MKKTEKEKIQEILQKRLEAREDSNPADDELIKRLKKAQEKMNTVRLSLRITKDLRDKLFLARIRTGKSMNELLETMIRKWLEDNEEVWKKPFFEQQDTLK